MDATRYLQLLRGMHALFRCRVPAGHSGRTRGRACGDGSSWRIRALLQRLAGWA